MPAAQLTTGGACHLQLSLVRRGLQALGDPKVDFLFIENVGNLVCPASHDLGEHIRVVLLSVTEGDDKPGKYPKMFRSSQALVISKMDLLPHVPFRIDSAIADAHAIQPDLTPLYVSAITGDGIANWCQFLENSRKRLLQSSVDHGSE
jgi:hydrogenase nickel incorporation protein HypB